MFPFGGLGITDYLSDAVRKALGKRLGKSIKEFNRVKDSIDGDLEHVLQNASIMKGYQYNRLDGFRFEFVPIDWVKRNREVRSGLRAKLGDNQDLKSALAKLGVTGADLETLYDEVVAGWVWLFTEAAVKRLISNKKKTGEDYFYVIAEGEAVNLDGNDVNVDLLVTSDEKVTRAVNRAWKKRQRNKTEYTNRSFQTPSGLVQAPKK